LVWLTGPSSPGLSIRTTVLLFDGLFCVEVAVEPADWVLPADWLAACPPPPAPAWSCVADWAVWLAFAAAEAADEALVWLTAPESPGLKIRTSTLRFVGLFCVEVAVELADCVLSAD
jgi:hypothetical protein